MKRTQVWIACLLSLPLLSQAVTLSEPIVRSGFGQRFIAEVEVFDLDRSQWLTLNAVIAAPETYALQGVEYPASVGDMNIFVLRHSDGRPYLRIVGERPLNEAFLNLILDIGWKEGHIIRKYTILPEFPSNDPRQQEGYDGYTLQQRLARREQRYLKRKIDPADQMMDTAKNILRTESAEDDEPVDQESLPQNTRTWRNRAAAINHPLPLKDERYRVSYGDTLHAIARRWDRPELGIYQKMLVLYQHNPQLFIGGNPDRMIRGRWMNTPKLIQYAPDTELAARAEWRALLRTPHKWHNGQYLAEADESSNQRYEAPASSNAQNENSYQDPNDSQNNDQNTAKNGTNVTSGEQAIAQQLDRLAISHGMSKKEIETYQRLLQMENQIRMLIANVRKRSPKLAMSPELERLPAEPPLGNATDSQHDNAKRPIRPINPLPLIPGSSSPSVPAAEHNQSLSQGSGTIPGVHIEKDDPGSLPAVNVSSNTASASKPSAPLLANSVTKKTRSKPPRLPQPPLPVNDSITDNIPWWVGLLALLGMGTAIGGAIIVQVRRKQRQAIVDVLMKESAELADAPTIFTDTGQSIHAAASAADLAGAGSLNRESLLNVDTDTHIDPLTEADVYISYERYDSAEALLKVAEESHPDAPEVLWRLFTVYHHMGRPIEKRAYAARLHVMYEPRDPKQQMLCEALGVEFGSVPLSESQREHEILPDEPLSSKTHSAKEDDHLPVMPLSEVLHYEMPQSNTSMLEKTDAQSFAAESESKKPLDISLEKQSDDEEIVVEHVSVAAPALPQLGDLAMVPMILIPELVLSEESSLPPVSDTISASGVELKKSSFSVLEEDKSSMLSMPSLGELCPLEIPALNFEFEKEAENAVKDNSSTELLVKNQHDLMHCQLELARMWMEQGRMDAASALLEAIVKTGMPVYAEEAQSLLDSMIR